MSTLKLPYERNVKLMLKRGQNTVLKTSNIKVQRNAKYATLLKSDFESIQTHTNIWDNILVSEVKPIFNFRLYLALLPKLSSYIVVISCSISSPSKKQKLEATCLKHHIMQLVS